MRECASKGDVGLGRCSLVRADFRALFPSALHIDLIEKLTYPTHHLLIVGVLSEECGSLFGRKKVIRESGSSEGSYRQLLPPKGK